MSYNGFMVAQFLATKLYIPPPRPKLVARPRLFGQLKDVLNCKLTLISAPAGFGKTTLVSEWALACGIPVAWLSLDEGDSDPVRFMTYLIAALQTIKPGLGEGLSSSLQSHQPPPAEVILTALLNEISTIPENFLLILDDYHSIDSQFVDQSLEFIVEHQPPQMHLVIATREDPSLPLARLRARGQLTELRAADLRFKPAEAADFLNRMMGLNLSDADIAAMEVRTEGWIAGLQLAALSMQGREDIASFIQAFTGSHRFVLDYLAEEVLKRQPELIRSFLLQTAILERFCTPLCNAVTDRQDGKEMLDVLERSNLFIIPLDDKCQWYRYHRLFADVLQTHLVETQSEQIPALHRRASAWYEQNGLRSDAIRHALSGKDFEHAAGLIELAGPQTEDGNIQQAAWLGWVKRLPEELIHSRPVLNVWYAYALLGSGELESAESRFKDAERWLELSDTKEKQSAISFIDHRPDLDRRMVVVDQKQFKSLPATIAIGRAYIAQALGNIPDTVKYASQVLDLVPDGGNFRHSQASMMLGMSHWASGDLIAAEQVFADYTMKLRGVGNISDAIGTSVVLAEIRLALGQLREAIDTVERCLQFVIDHGEPLPLDIADLHRELGVLYLERGKLDVATHHLQRSNELVEKTGSPFLRYRLCIARARLKETQADLDGALTILDEAECLYIRSPLPEFGPIAAIKARIWVTQGKLTKALRWISEQGLSVEDPPNYLRELEQITLVRILIAQYQRDMMDDSIHAVMRLLDRLLHAAEESKRVGSMIKILILQALTHHAQGDIASALVPLKRALTLAEPEGYVRIFVDEDQPMLELLGRMNASREDSTAGKTYVHRLLATLGGEESHPSSCILQPLIEPLSEHELEVLRLLRTELSGPEIARNRMVSLNTIRTHTQHIYAKLGVNNRRAAVRRAEELGLL